jgi:D-alanyl-D-alanine carboxypeptidase
MRHSAWRRLRAAVVALAIAGGMLVGPLGGATPVLGIGPLPACQILDVPANPGGYDDWATTLVDWTFTLGPKYKPPDLVSVSKGNVGGGGLVRQVAIDDLKALAAAAKANGTPLVAYSPYRSYKTQTTLFNGGVSAYGYDAAITYWGRPGHSEHQLGVTIDFVSRGDSSLSSSWESTRTGGWMAKNAWKYGWLMSYPKGKQDVVCYHYEPWHYRYYGRDLAKKIHDSGLTPREYLWANFTQFNTDLTPLATARASASRAASASPTASTPIEPSTGIGASSAPIGSPTPPALATTNTASGGLEPMVVFAIVLLALAVIGLIASVRSLRRQRRR